MRIRAVTAKAANRNINRIDVRHYVTWNVGNFACSEVRIDMQRKAVIWFWKLFEKAFSQHRPGPASALLRGLANEHDGAAKKIGVLCQKSRRAGKHRHMHVMTASMHHRNFFAGSVDLLALAGIRQAGLFFYGQTIQVRADEHDGAWPIREHTDNPKAAHPLGHLEPGFAKFICDPLRGLFLEQRQLRALVKLFVESLQSRDLLVDRAPDFVTDCSRRSSPWQEKPE